jgi:hypothetical protein
MAFAGRRETVDRWPAVFGWDFADICAILLRMRISMSYRLLDVGPCFANGGIAPPVTLRLRPRYGTRELFEQTHVACLSTAAWSRFSSWSPDKCATKWSLQHPLEATMPCGET